MAEFLEDNQDQGNPPLPSGYIAVKKNEASAPPLPSGYEPVKKKESSDSNYISQISSVASEPTNGSSGTLKTNKTLTDSESKMGTMSWNLEKLRQHNPEINQKAKEYQQANTVHPDKIEQIKSKVNDEYNQTGLVENASLLAKKGWNGLVDFIGFGGSDETKETWKAETDKFTKERKSVEDKINKERNLAKLNGKPDPIYSKEQIDEMVKARRVKKLVDSEKQTQVRSFLENQEKNTDEFGKNTRERMGIYKASELSSLGEKDQENLKKQNIVLPALSNSLSILNDIKDKVSKGEQLTLEEQQEAGKEYENYKNLTQQALELKDEFVNNRDKIKDGQVALDLFKRDYSFGRHIANLDASVHDIVSGLGGAIDYGYEASNLVKDKLGIPTLPAEADELRMAVRGASKDVKNYADNLRSQTAKPISVDDINGFDDLGSWMADMVVSQAPIVGLVATGGAGIGTIGTYSTGQKYESMIDEMNPEEGKIAKDYSAGQLVGVPAVYGVSETASAVVDYYLLKNAGKIYKTVAEPERKLIVDGIANKIFKPAKELVKTAGIEAIDEASTQVSENFADKVFGGDKDKSLLDGVKDSAIAGAVLGSAFSAIPMMVGEATSKYSVDSKLKENASKVMALQSQLDKSELSNESRKIIEEQLSKAKETLNLTIKKQIGDMSSLSNSQFEEINRIEKTQANIKDKAKEIKIDDSVNKDVKKQILKSLKEEFDASEQRRVDLLQKGANVQLEKLEDSEVIRLKDKAQRQLMKEQNPDGTKNIKLNDEQISKRALEIYKEEKLKKEAKDAETQKPTKATEQIESQPKAEIQETEQESVELNTSDKFKKTVDLFNQINETEGGSKKRSLVKERKAFLEEHPTVKYVDDNIREVTKQLEEKGELKKSGDCP